MKNIYQVTAIIKANCTEYKYVIDVTANSQKSAIETARGMWDKVHHLFHIKARRLEAHEEALYAFWKQYEGEPQTKSKPEEAHVDMDKMNRAAVEAAITRLTRHVKSETGDNIRDCFEAIAEGYDAAPDAIAAMEKEADDYINAVTVRFCANETETVPEQAALVERDGDADTGDEEELMTEVVYVGFMGGVWSAHGFVEEFDTLDELEAAFTEAFAARGLNVEFREAGWSERGLTPAA